MKFELMIALTLAFSVVSISVGKCEVPDQSQEARTADLPENWRIASVLLTGFVETGKAHPADAGTVTNDFDGQGLSVGILQWNFGTGSISELVEQTKDVDRVALESMGPFSQDFIQAARDSAGKKRPEALRYIRTYSRNSSIDPKFESAVHAFLMRKEVLEAQNVLASKISGEAWILSNRWTHAVSRDAPPTFQEYAFFVDLVTQSGTLYMDRITALSEDFASFQRHSADEAFNWRARLAARHAVLYADAQCTTPSPTDHRRVSGHTRDGQRNCVLWTQLLENPNHNLIIDKLLFLSFIRSYLAPNSWAQNYYNRRGVFATGIGYSNSRYCDFRSLFSAAERGEVISNDAASKSCHG